MRQCIMILLFFLTPSYLLSQIDLVTLPKRRSVELTIYNSADLTLVRDRRVLSFKKGSNKLQFSWSNTLIDPTSLEIHFKTHQDDLELTDTLFPPQNKDSLQWHVESHFDGDAEVEITYFTSGLTWSSSYMAYLNHDDTQLDLNGQIKISNSSGEDYPNAKINLIVGTINLIDQIATLAQKGGGGGWNKLKKDDRHRAHLYFNEAASKAADSLHLGYEKPREAKGIVKEELSEYFIFTVEGSETIPHGWTKAMNSLAVNSIPVDITFRFSQHHSSQPQRFIRFDNKSLNEKKDKTNLGQSPLPNGLIHIFKNLKNGHISYLSQINMPHIAINDKCELNTGDQFEVSIDRKIKKYTRDNIRFDHKQRVKSYDEIFIYEVELKNSLAHKVKLEIERQFERNSKVYELPFKNEVSKLNALKYYPTLEALEHKKYTYKVEISKEISHKEIKRYR